MSVLILGAVLLQALVGIGLMVAGLAKAMAWGWRPAMATENGKWPAARKMLVAGAVLIVLAGVQAFVVITVVYVIVATSYAQ